MTEFIMLVGLPASGKSTYAEKLKKEGYNVHSSDAIREELTGDVNTQDKNTEVFSILHSRIKDDLKSGISCVYDATNMSMKRRKAFLDSIKKYECYKKCVLFVAPVETCKDRNDNRDRKVPNEAFDKMLRQFDIPMKYEGWDEIEVIANEEYDYKNLFQKTVNFDQHNSHYKLSLFDHMFRSFRCFNINDSQNAGHIAAALFHHDIGKLITQSFVNSKGEVTKEAHYYGHEHAGAYLFLSGFVLHEIKTNDLLYIASLINWHMRPFAWDQSEKAMQRDKKLIGEDMYNDIIVMHKADLAAH